MNAVRPDTTVGELLSSLRRCHPAVKENFDCPHLMKSNNFSVSLAMNNLYWSVYKNLEKELLETARHIHFCDNQLSVYSIRIADLLVRTCIEIEALSKELYRSLGGNINPTDANGASRPLYFDTDCLKLLEDKWDISKKEVIISSSEFYFKSYGSLTPLKKSYKRGTSGSKWKQAYQAVKHDRYNNLKVGNVSNLIEAMAALFLLNLFYRDSSYSEKSFDPGVGSSLFSVKIANALSGMHVDMDDSKIHWTGDSRESSMFILKMTEDEIRGWHYSYCTFFHSLNKSINADPYLQKSAREDYELFTGTISDVYEKLSKSPLWKNAFYKAIKEQRRTWKSDHNNEFVINKNQQVYPELHWSDAYPGESEVPMSLNENSS